jgi:DNA-binding NtrC family response regulator
MPAIKLTPDAISMVESYRWPGNVRQLKSIAEQISVIEHNRIIGADLLKKYLPVEAPNQLPMRTEGHGTDYLTDRDIIFKILYQLRQEVEELKGRVVAANESVAPTSRISSNKELSNSIEETAVVDYDEDPFEDRADENGLNPTADSSRSIDTLSIHDVSADLIKKALERNRGKRKLAAQELGISERTLYRKIKELNLDL